MDTACCGNCAFYRDEDGDEGFCMRYPPTVMADGDGVFQARPVVDESSFCGEHRPVAAAH